MRSIIVVSEPRRAHHYHHHSHAAARRARKWPPAGGHFSRKSHLSKRIARSFRLLAMRRRRSWSAPVGVDVILATCLRSFARKLSVRASRISLTGLVSRRDLFVACSPAAGQFTKNWPAKSSSPETLAFLRNFSESEFGRTSGDRSRLAG